MRLITVSYGVLIVRLPPLKIILLGDGRVGKTSIRRKYMGGAFKTNYMMTIGADFSIKRIGQQLLQIWDLAGQESFLQIRRNYYSGASGAFLVFDITNEESFFNLEKWIDEIELYNGEMIPTIIIANKIDLLEFYSTAIDDQKLFELQKKLQGNYKFNFPLIKTSAVTGHQIEKAFNELIKEINMTR